jgi:hypothetical protein
VAQRRFLHCERQTKDDAIELLDESGNAEQASLTRMTDCMFDFPLSHDGPMGLTKSDTSMRHLPRRAV